MFKLYCICFILFMAGLWSNTFLSTVQYIQYVYIKTIYSVHVSLWYKVQVLLGCSEMIWHYNKPHTSQYNTTHNSTIAKCSVYTFILCQCRETSVSSLFTEFLWQSSLWMLTLTEVYIFTVIKDLLYHYKHTIQFNINSSIIIPFKRIHILNNCCQADTHWII